MNLTEKYLDEAIQEKKNIEEINIFNFNSMSINKIIFSQRRFELIEYLSLRNNQIRDISFISSFPFLWYLDVRDNYVKYHLM